MPNNPLANLINCQKIIFRPRSKSLDWDQCQVIGYRDDHALLAKDQLRFQVKFFHLGFCFKSLVHIYELKNGQAQEMAYDSIVFNYGKSVLKAAHMLKDLGFAGFRVKFHIDLQREIMTFLHTSYFRAVGEEWQYGLSVAWSGNRLRHGAAGRISIAHQFLAEAIS